MNLAKLVKRAMAAVPGSAKAAVIFSDESRSASEETGTTTSTSTWVAGVAVQVEGDPKTYERLGLVETSAPTLFFTPNSAGECPTLGSRCEWGGSKHTVKEVQPVAPNGTVLAAYLVVSR